VSRLTSSTNIAELAQPDIIGIVMVDLDFASGHTRVHDGIGELAFGGNTYYGIGQFGAIESISEGYKDIARQLKLTLSGVDNSLLTIAMTEIYQGRTCTVYVGFLNSQTNVFLDTPEQVYVGRMDFMQIDVGKTSAINLFVENRTRREPQVARYTTEDQKLLYPNDTFFDQVPFIAGRKATWGQSPYASGGSPGGGRGTPIMRP